MAGVSQRFDGHAPGDGAIPDYRHHVSVDALLACGEGHAYGGGMLVEEWPTPKVSYSLLAALGEAGEAAGLAYAAASAACVR